MHASTPFDTPTSATAGRQPTSRGKLIIDAPMRMFHWLFALSFVGAYLTADGERWRMLHVTLGYTMAGLLAFRLLYGLFGPRQASLGMLWRKLVSVKTWLGSAARTQSPAAINWNQLQTPLMAIAIFALLAMVVPLTLSGYATFNEWGDILGGDWLEDTHELLGETFLALVLAHLALIAGFSLLRQKNLAQPMLNGRIAGTGPDPVRNNRAWLAALLLLAVFAYGAWEWQQSPAGLIPPAGRSIEEHDD